MKRKVIITILILGTILVMSAEPLLNFVYYIGVFSNIQFNTSIYVNAVVKEALHIPYQSYRELGKPYEYKEGWGDLEHIIEEEWFSMKCEHQKTESGMYFSSFSAEQHLSKEEQKHIHCVKPISNDRRYPYKNKMPKHCTGILNCPSISVTFYDYILQYPKVLNNVIKIMEKPCDYLSDDFPIPTSVDYQYTDKEREQLVREGKLFVYNGVRSKRQLLYCDKLKHQFYQKDRTYSVIYILDKDGNRKTEIIVPRKDNAHLVKDKK